MSDYNIILERFSTNIINKISCLIHFKYSKIKNIANLLYKKFGTNFPHFNQNHSYTKLNFNINLTSKKFY
jgi:hypothetical protein